MAGRFQVRALAAVHRTGDLEIGDLAVVVAAAADHRDEAFAACRALIEDVKATVPVWKQQRSPSGESEWVNSAYGPAERPGCSAAARAARRLLAGARPGAASDPAGLAGSRRRRGITLMVAAPGWSSRWSWPRCCRSRTSR